jgi:hypothetical protein
MEKYTLTLKSPLKIEGGEITELELAEPTANQLDFAESNGKTATSQTIHLIALVSGKNYNIIKELSARDFRAASNYLKIFLEGSPETGEK